MLEEFATVGPGGRRRRDATCRRHLDGQVAVVLAHFGVHRRRRPVLRWRRRPFTRISFTCISELYWNLKTNSTHQS